MSWVFDDRMADKLQSGCGKLFDESVGQCEEVIHMEIPTIEIH